MLGSLLWRAGEDVVLVGRAAQVAAIRAAGLSVEGVLGGFNAAPHAEERLSARPELVLLTVKTQDIVAALRENAAVLQGVPLVVLQNGLRGEALAASVLPGNPLVSGVVALHAQHLKAGHVVLLQSEGLLVGRLDQPNDALVERVRALLDKAVPTATCANMRGARWTKLIVSLHNVLPGLCGAPFRQTYKDPLLRALAVGMMREGIAVAERAGIHLESIPGTSVPLLELEKQLLESPAARSSSPARPTEVDYLNGEIVRLGRSLGVATPLNEAAVRLAARVAATRRHLSLQEVVAAFK